MKTDPPELARQRANILNAIDAADLSKQRTALAALIKPVIGLSACKAKKADLASGATRLGGNPDLGKRGWPKPTIADQPLLFVMQIQLADITRFDVDQVLPASGLLSLFSDTYCDDVRVIHTPTDDSLEPHTSDDPFTACGLDFEPGLMLPIAPSPWLDRELSPDETERYANLDYAWRTTETRWQRASAGDPGYHQLLGYSGSDVDLQGADEAALIAFDSDDRATMSWGDVQRVWTLISHERLRAGQFDPLRVTL
ncbi:MAG: DUF1963 domain-containing protein [Proteobacteria bacterium]|nr:DUF1963 domain-containing protein [Pseudomonadota bacterium]